MVNDQLKQQFQTFLDGPPGDAMILLENQAIGGEGRAFANAVDWVVAWEPADVPAAFEKLRVAAQDGRWAAGFLSYELGNVLEPKLAPLLPVERSVPLMLFGLFESPEVGCTAADLKGSGRRAEKGVGDVRPLLSESQFSSDFERIKDYIAAGDTYQINHTFPISFKTPANTKALYGQIRARARGQYGGYLDLGQIKILSGSPELFLEKHGNQLVSRPMKGTAPRGRTNAEDRQQQDWLRNDPKNRAENLMILDLIRNDMGRVAKTGSVEVHDQFAVDKYPTLHAMTSTVRASVPDAVSFEDIMRALFPCGSITGAPKIRAMEIIRELETEPRGIYTGSIGWIAPNGDFSFNVAIRTAVLSEDGVGTLGIGSGIVWDSSARSEYRETLLKAAFLTNPDDPVELFETLRWTQDEGFPLLSLHMERLAASAEYFQFPFDRAAAETVLAEAAKQFNAGVCRVRLALAPSGEISITSAPFVDVPQEASYRLAISPTLVNSSDPYLFHKTTRRGLYDSEYERCARDEQADEVLFLNEHYEVVEGSRTNIFVEKDSVLITPPVSCGLLPGCLRRSLLEDPNVAILEAPLTMEDLRRADKIYVGNALRGLIPAELITADQTIAVSVS